MLALRSTLLRQSTRSGSLVFVRNVSDAPAPPLLLKIREGLKAAMRSGNTMEKTVIRGILSEVKNKSIDNAASVGTDLKLHGLLRTMIVTRQKSIAEFKAADRQDLVDKESEEVEILKKYAGLVSVASEEDLDKKVQEVISGLPEEEQKQVNKVMSKIPWGDVESKWNSSRNAVAASVKRVIGQRSFSTSARQMSKPTPFGLPKRKPVAKPNITRRSVPGVKRIIAVSSAKGGVGKSTVSANLALSLFNMGYEVGILDVDLYGPSIPKLFGLTDAGEPLLDKKTGHMIPVTNYGVKTMSMGYLVDSDKAVAWRGLLIQKALEQLLFEVKWNSTPLSATEDSTGNDLDVLVLDLPPGTGDVQITLAQLVNIDAAVLVSTPQDLALIDVIRGLELFRIVQTPVLGVVENMSVFVCPNCHHETSIFGGNAHSMLEKEANKRGVSVLASIPLVPEICQDADSGKPTAVSAPESPPGLVYSSLAGIVAKALGLKN